MHETKKTPKILWCGGVLRAAGTSGIHALPMRPMGSLVSFSVAARNGVTRSYKDRCLPRERCTEN
jgi:hypothetical protein